MNDPLCIRCRDVLRSTPEDDSLTLEYCPDCGQRVIIELREKILAMHVEINGLKSETTSAWSAVKDPMPLIPMIAFGGVATEAYFKAAKAVEDWIKRQEAAGVLKQCQCPICQPNK